MLDYFPLPQGPYGSGTGFLAGWQITSYFGGRVDPLTGRPGNHGGMDLAHADCNGCEIYAPVAGVVAQGWDNSGGGNWTSLTTDDGRYLGFGHASRFAEGVNGRHVPAGTVLAYVGTTGGSTGAHLHVAYKARGAGAYSDPYDELVGAAERIVGRSRLVGHAELLHAGALHLEEDVTDDDVKKITAGTTELVVAAMNELERTLGVWLGDSRKYDEAAALRIALNMAKLIHDDLSVVVVALGGAALPPFTVNRE